MAYLDERIEETMYNLEAEKVIQYIIEDIDNATVKDVKRTLERAAQIFANKTNNAIHQTQADSILQGGDYSTKAKRGKK